VARDSKFIEIRGGIRMIRNEQEAIHAGRVFLIELGIGVLEVKRVQKINGSVRSEYLPDSASDFWMITFDRSSEVLPSCIGETDVEREIISAVALENDKVTMSVECDGSVKVV